MTIFNNMSMKNWIKLIGLSAMFALLLMACKQKDSAVRDAAKEGLPAPAPTTGIQSPLSNPAAPTLPNQSTAAQNAAGEWHYTCPNGHPGSGTAGNCASCGTALVHNQAFHAGEATNATTAPAPSLPNQQPEPAQNASGVWHYTCPSGHPGGAGTAATCSSCGATLVHNQAYHN